MTGVESSRLNCLVHQTNEVNIKALHLTSTVGKVQGLYLREPIGSARIAARPNEVRPFYATINTDSSLSIAQSISSF